VVQAAAVKQKTNDDRRSVESKLLKVPADRLDALIDRVGELVIAGVGTHLQISHINQPTIMESAELLLSLVEDIRDMALRLRMVAIGEVFSRFPRVVRDVSKELGKDIELRIRGAEAELDKSMVDKIGDPLMHLIRNSMDHGIESAETRLARGKPARGTVELNAYHESGSINIEVRDDGAGLDRERILRKAVESGLVSADDKLSDQDIDRLILAPGFSTAEKVTNLSGRGVGMDVVRSNIEALRGTLDIESVPGQGTTMRLCLPLTLAIIDGFHVGVGNSHFIIPLDMVVECIELPADVGVREYLEQRDEALPFIRLHELFNEPGAEHPRPRVIIVRFARQRAGLVVDRIYGKCQTVIKPLGPLFTEVPAISGSTIIGNGEVGMILDIPALIQAFKRGGNGTRLTKKRNSEVSALTHPSNTPLINEVAHV
jgi:two-component system chemotaxis sensor kinase CheA